MNINEIFKNNFFDERLKTDASVLGRVKLCKVRMRSPTAVYFTGFEINTSANK